MRSDGAFVWARTRVSVTEDEGVALAITHIEDVTEQRILEAQLLVGKLEFGRVVGEHFPAAERVVLARLAVDADADVDLVGIETLLGGGDQGFCR